MKKQKNAKAAPKFKVGDIVKSATGSSDITMMGDVWHGRIHSVRPTSNRGHGPADGHVYVTIGYWASDPPLAEGEHYTSRQLWAEHLELDEAEERGCPHCNWDGCERCDWHGFFVHEVTGEVRG